MKLTSLPGLTREVKMLLIHSNMHYLDIVLLGVSFFFVQIKGVVFGSVIIMDAFTSNIHLK